MTHQQLAMAAQQQLTPLQQQQEQLAQVQAQSQAMQQSSQGFQQNMMPNPQLLNQQGQNQLNPQLQAQLRLQLAQANLAGRQAVQNPNLTQAQALLRAQAQSQVLQGQNFNVPQQNFSEQAGINLPSPRPPQQAQIQANVGPSQRMPPDRAANIKATLAKLAAMTDQQREGIFQNVSDLSDYVDDSVPIFGKCISLISLRNLNRFNSLYRL